MPQPVQSWDDFFQRLSQLSCDHEYTVLHDWVEKQTFTPRDGYPGSANNVFMTALNESVAYYRDNGLSCKCSDKAEKPEATLEPGVYETAEGIFIVKWNKQKTHVYAKRLVESSDRVNEEGMTVQFDFEYAPGAINTILSENLMPLERAKPLMVKYGRCIACGRHLKRAVSVERGIGPVCVKMFGVPQL